MSPAQLTPVFVGGLTNVVSISAGYYHTAAVKADGTVWAWGLDNVGQLGNDTAHGDSWTPVQVTTPTGPLTGARRVDCGAYFCLAVLQDGTVRGWGHNYLGELGDGTQIERPQAVVVPNLWDIKAVAGGGGFTLALRADATVLASGQNNAGQLGNNTTTTRYTFLPVTGFTYGSLTPVLDAIAAGEDHSIARWGEVTWGWGKNTNGQVGGPPDPQMVPRIFWDIITGIP
jgi:alpha-tubulin suppressor-like RCC1 family protein